MTYEMVNAKPKHTRQIERTKGTNQCFDVAGDYVFPICGVMYRERGCRGAGWTAVLFQRPVCHVEFDVVKCNLMAQAKSLFTRTMRL
ncbi:MAG TPA: hypothetical protein VGJ20_30775 [Xanthobacteraceae bacterium]|jgi:hypothetical protein